MVEEALRAQGAQTETVHVAAPPPLMRCCLHSQGRPDLSLAIYLQLQLPSVFDFIKVAGGGGGGGGKRRLEGCTWCPTPQHPCRH